MAENNNHLPDVYHAREWLTITAAALQNGGNVLLHDQTVPRATVAHQLHDHAATLNDVANRADIRPMLDEEGKHLLNVCIERYIADIRQTCREDQGDAEGKSGTVGYDLQRNLRKLKKWVNNERVN